MRAVIQRVLEAQVSVDSQVVSQVGPGLLTLLGFAKGDDEKRLREMLKKILELRIFEDESGKMNRSLLDVGGEHLLVSQFTLLADTSSGRRPSFGAAMAPDEARALYDRALVISQELGAKTKGGVFQADMRVSLTNSGPVTLVLESSS